MYGIAVVDLLCWGFRRVCHHAHKNNVRWVSSYTTKGTSNRCTEGHLRQAELLLAVVRQLVFDDIVHAQSRQTVCHLAEDTG